MARIESNPARLSRELICDLLVFIASFFFTAPLQRRPDRGVTSFHENDLAATPTLRSCLFP